MKRTLLIATILLFCITGAKAQRFDLESLGSSLEDSTPTQPSPPADNLNSSEGADLLVLQTEESLLSATPSEDMDSLTAENPDLSSSSRENLISSAYAANYSESSFLTKGNKMTVRNFNIGCMANLAFQGGTMVVGRHVIMLSYERGVLQRGVFRIGIDLGFTKYSYLGEDDADMAKKSGITALLMGKYGFELCWKDSRIKFGFGQTVGGLFKVGIATGAYFRLTCYVIGRLAVNATYQICGAFSLSDKNKTAILSLMGFGITYQLKK